MFVLLFSFFILIFSTVLCEECKLINDCSCKTSKGTVDLSKSKNEFAIQDNSYNYKFKPCGIVNECKVPGSTDTATVCQIPNGTSQGFDLGDSNTATFSGNPETNNLVLKYTTSVRQTQINIFCARNEEGKLVSVKENPITYYTFELQTRHACIGPEPEPQPPSHKISLGSVLLIIFFVVLGVYFIAGMVFLKFVRGAQGTEMIPNYDFWTSLPGYIKDGVLFTCRGCKAQTSYSKI